MLLRFFFFFFLFLSGPSYSRLYYSRACPCSPPLPWGEVCLALWLTSVSWGVTCTSLPPYFARSCDLLCFCFAVPCEILVPQLETKLPLPPVAAWSLNHWASREVPDLLWPWDDVSRGLECTWATGLALLHHCRCHAKSSFSLGPRTDTCGASPSSTHSRGKSPAGPQQSH